MNGYLLTHFQGINLVFGPFDAFEHDSTCVKIIRLEEKLADKIDFSEGPVHKVILALFSRLHMQKVDPLILCTLMVVMRWVTFSSPHTQGGGD